MLISLQMFHQVGVGQMVALMQPIQSSLSRVSVETAGKQEEPKVCGLHSRTRSVPCPTMKQTGTPTKHYSPGNYSGKIMPTRVAVAAV